MLQNIYTVLGTLFLSSKLGEVPNWYKWTQALLLLTATMAVSMYWLWALNKRIGKQLYWRIALVIVFACQVTYSIFVGFGTSSDNLAEQLLSSLLLLLTALIGALPTWLVAFAYAFLPWKKLSR